VSGIEIKRESFIKTRATAYPIWNRFQRSPDDQLSLREQLVRFFRKGVADGTLQPGIRLPASRVLAQELGLSRITVSGAYEQLVAEGFLEARREPEPMWRRRLPSKSRFHLRLRLRNDNARLFRYGRVVW
jgi:DNA-binding transcriptional MocR family regulator